MKRPRNLMYVLMNICWQILVYTKSRLYSWCLTSFSEDRPRVNCRDGLLSRKAPVRFCSIMPFALWTTEIFRFSIRNGCIADIRILHLGRFVNRAFFYFYFIISSWTEFEIMVGGQLHNNNNNNNNSIRTNLISNKYSELDKLSLKYRDEVPEQDPQMHIPISAWNDDSQSGVRYAVWRSPFTAHVYILSNRLINFLPRTVSGINDESSFC